jgi:uncharacterized membrane protein
VSDPPAANETARIEAFSDGVFAIAITLLILEIRVPPSAEYAGLARSLAHLWPSFLAFLASFMTIGVMWVNHHRLFTLIKKYDDGLIVWNLLLLLGVTFVPFPTALLAEHLRGEGQEVAGVLYAGTFLYLAIIFNLMWRYTVKMTLCAEHLDVASITKQYALGPIMYLLLVAVAYWSGTAGLVFSTLYAVYFALPPRLWQRKKAA